MKKSDVLIKKGIKLRSVTEEDRKQAKTTLQRSASFVITTANGEEYYSKNGSLSDCLWADANSKKKSKKAKYLSEKRKKKSNVVPISKELSRDDK